MRTAHARAALALLLLAAAAPPPAAAQPQQQIDWSPVRRAVDTFPGYPATPFAVLVGNASGLLFTYARGTFNLSAPLAVASASKWLSAMAIGLQVQRGTGGLDWGSPPQAFISGWPAQPDARGNVSLRQALGFVTGLGSVPCTDGIGGDTSSLAFWACVANVSASNPPPLPFGPPGTAFVYGGQHLHVAGAMAAAAVAGSPGTGSWAAVFAQLRAAAGLPAGCCPFTPLANPLVAGGLVTTPLAYAELLRQYAGGSLLAAPTVTALEVDATPAGSVRIAQSPLADMGFDWHYAAGGHWLECRANATCLGGDPGCSGAPLTAWAPHCDDRCEQSSPGAFGFYPYINRCFRGSGTDGFWGIVAVPNGSAVASVLLGSTLWPAVRAAFASQFGASPSASPSPTPSATGTVTASSLPSALPSTSATPTGSLAASSAASSGTSTVTVSPPPTSPSASATASGGVSVPPSGTPPASLTPSPSASSLNATGTGLGGAPGTPTAVPGGTVAGAVVGAVAGTALMAGAAVLYTSRARARAGGPLSRQAPRTVDGGSGDELGAAALVGGGAAVPAGTLSSQALHFRVVTNPVVGGKPG
jgi:hypothetical protein